MIETAIKGTTQQHLDIHTIQDHLLILKDGSVALVLQVNAINFGLLSEEEQDATIFAYAALLNSLSFTLQIVIRSIRKDITAYIELLDQQMENTRSQKIREQIVKYRAFVKSLVKDNRVMEKKFYAVIPFSAVELGLTAKSFNPLTPPPQKPAYDDSYILDKAKVALYPRRDHLIRQFARLGLRSHQLNTQELVALFFRVYNPSAPSDQAITLPSDYETPAVQTKVVNLDPNTPKSPPAAPPATLPPIPTPSPVAPSTTLNIPPAVPATPPITPPVAPVTPTTPAAPPTTPFASPPTSPTPTSQILNLKNA